MNFYNEIDPFAAEWLGNLAREGHIGAGRVDNRSILEVKSDELREATQAHFFAGIGVWSHALRLAGWPDDREVWTGSCPCQPFSVAGRGKGTADERHLWPEWFRLISECRPPVVFGEQVVSKDGRAWLDAVRADLEGVGYAVGAADLCAAGVGAPHIRQRLYFVGIRVADAPVIRQHGRWTGEARNGRDSSWVEPERLRDAGGLVDAERTGLEGHPGHGDDGRESGRDGASPYGPTATSGPWGRVEWLPCRDGKARPAEPGIFPLAHGATQRVGRLRAYGNAIVAPLAAEFIRSVMDLL